MRRITSSLAALLSFLVVSTSVSASACDLSCWLRQAHSDCHTVSSATSDRPTAMSMPAEMDKGSMNMGSDPSANTTGIGVSMTGVPVHPMSMFPQACTHETCSQVLASASPASADHSRHNSLHRIAINIATPVNLLPGFHLISHGTSPPKTLAIDPLVTSLRI